MKAAAAAPTPMAEKALYLSHFTPSLMQPQTLQNMLIQRQSLLDACYDDVIQGVTTGTKHHYLFVGPRGIGKTHLVSLLHHRLSNSAEVKAKGLIAWMREEEWGVTSFFELVLRVLRSLDQSYPALDIAARLNDLYDLPVRKAEAAGTALLLEVLGDKTLVVLLENLDDLFGQIGDAGQRQLRAFIQNHPQVVLVTTTPALFAGVSLQKSPFYGFFDIQPLEEFSLQDVTELLHRIAVERGDTALSEFIETPQGRARIRAVHHLAEGNPRIYVIFAQFLSRQALDELVQAVMHTLDELTPYYQARMRELSGQQRKIVEYLVRWRGAAPVKQIAKACFITPQTCSGQLKVLREKRYVRSVELGRESYYELTEPLMRLSMEVKQQRGEPIGLFVEILRIWYTESELHQWLSSPPEDSRLSLRYVERALELIRQPDGTIDPIFRAQTEAFRTYLRKDDRASIESLMEEVAATEIAEPAARHLRALLLLNWVLIEPRSKELLTSQSDGLKRDLLGVVSLAEQAPSLETYTAELRGCLGLMSLDTTFGEQALTELVPHLLRRPAHAYAAMLRVLSFEFAVRDSIWFPLLLDQLRPNSRFMKTMSRMTDPAFDWLQTGDDRRLLPLAREERELIVHALGHYPRPMRTT